jgi:hypothetical protein
MESAASFFRINDCIARQIGWQMRENKEDENEENKEVKKYCRSEKNC